MAEDARREVNGRPKPRRWFVTPELLQWKQMVACGEYAGPFATFPNHPSGIDTDATVPQTTRIAVGLPPTMFGLLVDPEEYGRFKRRETLYGTTSAAPPPDLTLESLQATMAELQTRFEKLPKLEIQIGDGTGQMDAFGMACARSIGAVWPPPQRQELIGYPTVTTVHGIPIVARDWYPAGAGALVELRRGQRREGFGAMVDYEYSVPILLLNWSDGELKCFKMPDAESIESAWINGDRWPIK